MIASTAATVAAAAAGLIHYVPTHAWRVALDRMYDRARAAAGFGL